MSNLDKKPHIEKVCHSISYRRPESRRSDDDDINLLLVQQVYPDDLLLYRAGEGIYTGQKCVDDHDESRQQVRRMLQGLSTDADLVVLSEHPANGIAVDLFQRHAEENKQILIVRLGYHSRDEGTFNSVAVLAPGYHPVYVDQISMSVEDISRGQRDELLRGRTVNFFDSPIGSLAVLNCQDYTHAGVIQMVAAEQPEILIVPTFNPAFHLFDIYSHSDLHRLFCFIIVSNIANYGGSGVYGPFRRKNKKLDLDGGVLASLRGQTTVPLDVQLPMSDLRHFRKLVAKYGPDEYRNKIESDYFPHMPAEMFFRKDDAAYRQVLERVDPVKTVDLDGIYEPTTHNRHLRVGVAHLKALETGDYIESNYNISSSPNASKFRDYVSRRIEHFREDLRSNNERVDFLVFPEVFLPLGLAEQIEGFATEFNTIVIGGVEYDGQPKGLLPQQMSGANRCFIWVPTASGGVQRYNYTKLTRSKYDACLPGDEGGHFHMVKGNRLLRFSHSSLGSFGVLICYDFSHHDIVYALNTHGLEQPLEMLFVVAYNPDGGLYESLCIADSHRYYQYVTICNVSQFGGSGVFAPQRMKGRRQTLLSAGKGVDGISIAELDLAGLSAAREADPLKPTPHGFQKTPGTLQFPIDQRLL